MRKRNTAIEAPEIPLRRQSKVIGYSSVNEGRSLLWNPIPNVAEIVLARLSFTAGSVYRSFELED